ncbi:TadE/TadG family type IV pilus assembly protein [Glutamicibacter sp. NPDC090743]|uniref:TadE/TadG family type IV pilus assembly protein n=1 Tax=Glutamicibacter sp. NPDC090743 TaxID=3364001 RepID=UPI0038225F32
MTKTPATDHQLTTTQRRWADDRGNVTLQQVIFLPAVLTLIWIIFQGAFWAHAHNIAQAAASSAYTNAKTYDGSAAAGRQAGYGVIDQDNTLSGASVSVSRGAVDTTVTVTGRGPSLVPLWAGPQIKVTYSGPTERWTTP